MIGPYRSGRMSMGCWENTGGAAAELSASSSLELRSRLSIASCGWNRPPNEQVGVCIWATSLVNEIPIAPLVRISA